MQGYLKLGIGYFIYSILMMLFMRFVLPIEFVFGGKFMFVQLVLGIVVMVILGRKFLRNSDNLLSYGEALKGIFLGSLIATVLSMFLTVAVHNGDQEYQNQFNKVQVENTISTMGFTLKVLGKTEDEIAVAQEEFRAQIEAGDVEIQEFPMQWNNLPMLLLIGVIGALIYALIAAIFVKQKQAGI